MIKYNMGKQSAILEVGTTFLPYWESFKVRNLTHFKNGIFYSRKEFRRNHCFNVEVATEYGIEEAILLENLYFWCKKNEANGTNIKNGKVWTYNSAKAFQELFPYMKISKIYRCLKHLENEGLIEVGCYNSNRYIQTRWYSVTKKALLYFEKSILQNEKWELQNEESKLQNVEMNITDINTDNKPNISTDNCACSFSEQELENEFKRYFEVMN